MSDRDQAMTTAGKAFEQQPTPILHRVADGAGWLGMALIVTAYLLVSLEVLGPDGLPYQLMNLIGATALIAISWIRGVVQGVILNMVWVAIAILGLVR